MGKTNVTVNMLHEEFDLSLLDQLGTLAEAHKYTPCEAGLQQKTGFIAPVTPGEFVWQQGPYVFVHICVEKRVPPSDVVDSIAEKRIEKIQESGHAVSLDESLQITEQVRVEMWGNISPTIHTYWVAIHKPTRMVFNFCSEGKAELNNALLRKAIGTFPVEHSFNGAGLYAAVDNFLRSDDENFAEQFRVEFTDVLHIKTMGHSGKASVKLSGFDDLREKSVRGHWLNAKRLDKVGAFLHELEQSVILTPSGTLQFEQVDGDEETWDEYGAQARVLIDAELTRKIMSYVRTVAHKFTPLDKRVELALP